MEPEFKRTFKDEQHEAWQIAEDHGWHEPTIHPGEIVPRCATFGERLMLIVSEVAEALEAYRDGDIGDLVMHTPNGKPDGIAVECADIQIRLWDLCEEHNIPLTEAIEVKTAYNRTRPYRHGKKAI